MTNVTICGNLTAAPELRFTPSGQAVANLNVAVNHRKFNKQTNEWEDDGADFYGVSVWQKQAENVAGSLDKGMAVIVTGRLKSRSYETKEGEKRTVWEITADHIGPSLKNAEAKVSRNEGAGGGGQGAGWQQRTQQQAGGWGQGGAQQTPSVDPWKSAGGQGQITDEVPF